MTIPRYFCPFPPEDRAKFLHFPVHQTAVSMTVSYIQAATDGEAIAITFGKTYTHLKLLYDLLVRITPVLKAHSYVRT